MTYRVGRTYGIHVYEGDRPVATFHDPDEAARFVAAINQEEAMTTSSQHPDDEASAEHDARTPQADPDTVSEGETDE